MLNMFITMGGVGIVIPVLPTYLQIFGVGGEVYGTLIAIFAFAQFLFSPLLEVYQIAMVVNYLSSADLSFMEFHRLYLD